MAKQKRKPTGFIRRGGRIIPIFSGKNARAAKDITSGKNRGNLAKIAGASAAGLGGLFAAGKIEKVSQALTKKGGFGRKAKALNRLAKIVKFSAKAVPALAIGTAMASIDRSSRDEGTAFDIGNKQGAANIALGLASAFAFARVGKRFEKFGLRGGKFPIKLRDI